MRRHGTTLIELLVVLVVLAVLVLLVAPAGRGGRGPPTNPCVSALGDSAIRTGTVRASPDSTERRAAFYPDGLVLVDSATFAQCLGSDTPPPRREPVRRATP